MRQREGGDPQQHKGGQAGCKALKGQRALVDLVGVLVLGLIDAARMGRWRAGVQWVLNMCKYKGGSPYIKDLYKDAAAAARAQAGEEGPACCWGAANQEHCLVRVSCGRTSATAATRCR